MTAHQHTKSSSRDGQKIGHLTVVREVERARNGARQFECLCDCGTTTKRTSSNLNKRGAQSCGCRKYEGMRLAKIKHGLSKAPIYAIWTSMRNRTSLASQDAGRCYLARGIKVCEAWQDFLTFLAWAQVSGYREGLTIERKDVDAGYCPENCCWIPGEQQAWNRRTSRLVTIDGETKCLAEWAKIRGLNYQAIHYRIHTKGEDPRVVLGKEHEGDAN